MRSLLRPVQAYWYLAQCACWLAILPRDPKDVVVCHCHGAVLSP